MKIWGIKEDTMKIGGISKDIRGYNKNMKNYEG